MRYKVYCADSKVKVPDSVVKTAKRKVWPKDTTEIEIEMVDGILYWDIPVMSERTAYLFNEGKLGIGIFVEDNPSWINRRWRSNISKRNRMTRHLVDLHKVGSAASGTIDISAIPWYEGNGCLSKQLYYRFWASYYGRSPYVEEGTDTIRIGIGRCDVEGEEMKWRGFRPYKMSEPVEIDCYNMLS